MAEQMTTPESEKAMLGFETGLGKATHKHVSIDKLIVNLSENIRHSKESGGVDTYQLSEMVDAIKEVGHIREPIVVEEQSDGLHVRRGFRRVGAALKIVADPKSPQALVEAMHKIPALVYKGPLTEIQRLSLINDQDNKRFKYSELLRLAFKYFKSGLKWNQVAYAMYRQWAEITGNVDILNEVDAISGEAAKKKRIDKWLQGTFQKILGNLYNIGPIAMDMAMVEAMEKDKLIKTKKNFPTLDENQLVPGPKVLLLGKQKRLDALLVAKQVDSQRGQWIMDEGGPEFNALLEKYAKEDKEGGPAPAPKALTYADLNELATKTAQSQTMKSAFEHASGRTGVDWVTKDHKMAALESKEIKFNRIKELFPENSPYLKAFVLIFEADMDAFNEWLEEQTEKLSK